MLGCTEVVTDDVTISGATTGCIDVVSQDINFLLSPQLLFLSLIISFYDLQASSITKGASAVPGCTEVVPDNVSTSGIAQAVWM